MTPPADLRLPRRVKNIIMRVRTGEILTLTYENLRTGDKEKVYSWFHSGRRVPTISAEEAIASGELLANDDGLFAETTQSWRARL
jgi:hypothetical protein